MRNKAAWFYLLPLALALSQGIGVAGTIKGKVTVPRARSLANMVVYLEKAPGEFPPPKEHVTVDQKNLTFVPHVLPVVAGEWITSDAEEQAIATHVWRVLNGRTQAPGGDGTGE